jgi:hypothetical protein
MTKIAFIGAGSTAFVGALAAEIELRAPADPGEATVLGDGGMRWIADRDGAIVATLTAAPLS